MIWDGAGGWKNSFQMRQDGRKCFCCTWGGSGERQTLVTVPGAPGQTRTGEPPAPVGLTTHPPRPPLLVACGSVDRHSPVFPPEGSSDQAVHQAGPFFVNWRIIALQYSLGFCHTSI